METTISSRERHLGAAATSRARAADAVTVTVVAVVLITLAAADGGYFPRSWGWSTLVFVWVATLGLTLRSDVRLGRLELAFLATLTAFGAWVGLSTLWTSSPTLTVAELERVLVYTSACWAALVVLRRRTVGPLLTGVWAASSVVALYSLATRLFPRSLGTFDPTAGYRLSEPIGYWNALGLFAAIGALLAVGFVAHGRGVLQPLAAASLTITLPTIYFTFSRGAWIALAIGLLGTVALDRSRLRLVTAILAVAIWPMLGVALAYRSDALADVQTSLERAAVDGRRLAGALLVLATVAAVTAVVFRWAAERVRVGPRARRAYAVALVAVAAAALLSLFARFGSPPTLVRNAYDAFTATPQPIEDGNLRTRLFNLSGTGRDDQWRVAWTQAEENRWLGSGSGTYERYWVRDRPFAGVIHDAHNLYLETLAELGPLGLLLLLAALGTPLVAAALSRSEPYVGAASGAWVAYLAHVVVDWDWELPAVTLAALGCALSLLLAARDEEHAWRLRPLGRGLVVAAAVLAAVFAAVGLVANLALASGDDAVDAGKWAVAADDAERARTWAPWSADPWELRGRAQFGAGELPAARRSFEKALAKDRNDWHLWFYLALASDGRARSRAAAEARRLNPLSPEVESLRAGRSAP